MVVKANIYFNLTLFTSLTLCLFPLNTEAQEPPSGYQYRTTAVTDTILIDSVSIMPAGFRVSDTADGAIDSVHYQVDFGRARFYPGPYLLGAYDSIRLQYSHYPDFLTKKYSLLDPGIIVPDKDDQSDGLYALESPSRAAAYQPFDGIMSSGSITRGITMGNNQNAVVNSELDLQIQGRLSDKVNIRASIQDAGIPIQEGGYSQGLDEFDEIFIELYADNPSTSTGQGWNVRAGDIDLVNTGSYFANFQKKVQGIAVGGTIKGRDSETSLYASGALVRGVFSRSTFTGQEGNQGPYKLVGPAGEQFILIVSGSERVFVNGLLLERGENKDYMMDYSAGEILFNPTYPITTDMRIVVEYQYAERNFTRFIGYGGGSYTTEKLRIGVYGYMESDVRNQPLQQPLTEEQVAVLQQAGDDPTQMTAPSAVSDTWSENKILYRKETLNGTEIFVFSNDPEDELYNVRFTRVGEGMGNYIIADNSTVQRIFEYVPPIGDQPQGNYEPVVQLIPPTRLQIGGVNSAWHPSEKTDINFELAVSERDQNLFSNIDKEDNTGYAAKLDARQTLWQREDSIKLDSFAGLDFIEENFNTVERLYNVEFGRDWNLQPATGNGQPVSPQARATRNQSLFSTGLSLTHPKHGRAQYAFQALDFTGDYSGRRHMLTTDARFGKLTVQGNTSYLQSRAIRFDSEFFRLRGRGVYSLGRAWVGTEVEAEDNRQRTASGIDEEGQFVKDRLAPPSQRFGSYEGFVGVGDSTEVYVEMGYRYRENDSVRDNFIQRAARSNTYYVKSQLIRSENTQLGIFANYRILKSFFREEDDEKSLNSRIVYNQHFLNKGVQFNTSFETASGTVPQQEFTYVEVEPGQGTHTWIDYNDNGVQELEEFEVAQFPDEARYIRVFLPNQLFLNIHRNKFGQTLTVNPQQFSSEESVLRRFHNQTTWLIDRKVRREGGSFDLNPFADGGDDQMSLAFNFRNVLFFNRGRQRYTASYTVVNSRMENLLSVGLLENSLDSHRLQFTHKFWESWLGNIKLGADRSGSASENFETRNFRLESYDMEPELSYLFSDNARFSVLYKLRDSGNRAGEEHLRQQTLGASFIYNVAGDFSLNGAFNYIDNDFSGNALSPVAFQMMEGLQPDKNFTWNLLVQRRITQYLDLNLTYFGRKSKDSRGIHTGSVQLRAYF